MYMYIVWFIIKSSDTYVNWTSFLHTHVITRTQIVLATSVKVLLNQPHGRPPACCIYLFIYFYEKWFQDPSFKPAERQQLWEVFLRLRVLLLLRSWPHQNSITTLLNTFVVKAQANKKLYNLKRTLALVHVCPETHAFWGINLKELKKFSVFKTTDDIMHVPLIWHITLTYCYSYTV